MLSGLTVVLPTFNEKQNLEVLIPELLDSTWVFKRENLRVIVVDDNSTDDTLTLLSELRKLDRRFSFVIRDKSASLPLSILEGIQSAETEYVAWLDADGSMPIKDLIRFASIASSDDLDVVVGSRFVTGGGFKGLNEVGRTSVRDFYSNIRNSQDSVAAVFLSRALNEFLRIVLRAGIRDLTSGFMIVRKKYINSQDFNANYGDYCPILIKRLVIRGAKIQEIGYICIPRIYGESKTGASLLSYIKRGIPYITRSIREVLRNSKKN